MLLLLFTYGMGYSRGIECVRRTINEWADEVKKRSD